MFLCGFENGGVGFIVHAERFFTHKVLSGADDVAIYLLVHIVRDGTIDHVDVVFIEKLVIIFYGVLHGAKLLEPCACCRYGVADADDDRAGHVLQNMTPTGCGTGKFLAHEATADDADTIDLVAHVYSPLYTILSGWYGRRR